MTGAELIAAERKRQIETLGYDAEHDAQYSLGTLAAAGAAYALNATGWDSNAAVSVWPFEIALYHAIAPGSSMEVVVKKLTAAGAFIAAEIDRIQAEAEERKIDGPF